MSTEMGRQSDIDSNAERNRRSLIVCAVSILLVALRRTTAAGMVGLLIGGCSASGDSASAEPAGWPGALADLTMVWSSEPGIDLVSGVAVPVRAYVESYVLVELMADEKYLYPGFAHAVEQNIHSGGDPSKKVLWPETWHNPEIEVGTQHNHILSVERSGRDVTVVVCGYEYDIAQLAPVSWVNNTMAMADSAEHASIFPMRISLVAPERETVGLPPQQGWARTPYEDVFGDWTVTGFLWDWMAVGWSSEEWPESEQVIDQCAEKAPDPLEYRVEVLDRRLQERADVRTLPAYPGWPMKMG